MTQQSVVSEIEVSPEEVYQSITVTRDKCWQRQLCILEQRALSRHKKIMAMAMRIRLAD